MHSSLLHTGVSAVMEAASLIDWMAGLMAELARTAPPNGFDPPYTTVHVGMIAGGTANNITARDCTFSGEVRLLPDESVDGWRERIEAEAARRQAALRIRHPHASIAFSTRMSLPGFIADPAAEALARALTGDADSQLVSYQTEAGHFQARGLATVICGPGSIAQAHQPDEFITTEQLDAGSAFIRRLIGRLAA